MPPKRLPPTRKKPTIGIVALKAGVGVSTVSRYLNGHYVSQTVRARLAKVIAQLGYSRSWTARNLSLGRRGSIGVVVDSSVDPWFVQLLAGIEEELASRDSSVMLASLELTGRYDPGPVLEWISGHRVDGLIVAKSQRRERAIVRAAVEAHLPLIAAGPQEAMPQVHTVRCDNIGGGALAARHLIELGHRQIAFVGGPERIIDSRDRFRGLRAELAAHGVALDPSQVFACQRWDAEAGTEFAGVFFSRRLSVTAIVLANEALAFGFLRGAHQHRVKVPQALSVIGFDGLPEGALFWPSLTTVSQPMRDMGRLACRSLFDLIEGSHKTDAALEMDLIVRESTARPSQRAHGAGPAGRRR